MQTIHTTGCSDYECAKTYGPLNRYGLPVDSYAKFTFDCPRCERTVGYCMGAADDTPALCDDCAAEVGHVEDTDESEAKKMA